MKYSSSAPGFIVAKLLILSLIIFLFLPSYHLLGWNGEPWEEMSREEIISIASQMTNSAWSPQNTIYNFGYGSTYHYFYSNTTYSGVAYSQDNPQENWDEFYQEVTTTSGGTTYYGNDCSGFTSIAWKLPERYTTANFEYDATHSGGYVDSLGAKGDCENVDLRKGDACVDDYNHIILYLETLSGGRMRSMEQTPWTAQQRVWYWSSLESYRQFGGET